mmetsp:Transcript_3730/g.23440  ORF Transcript_3730/g.23440 Transcript_3730/m.23440 type:complete len:314 (+) Transcript_3730:2758-3699(+)
MDAIHPRQVHRDGQCPGDHVGCMFAGHRMVRDFTRHVVQLKGQGSRLPLLVFFFGNVHVLDLRLHEFRSQGIFGGLLGQDLCGLEVVAECIDDLDASDFGASWFDATQHACHGTIQRAVFVFFRVGCCLYGRDVRVFQSPWISHRQASVVGLQFLDQLHAHLRVVGRALDVAQVVHVERRRQAGVRGRRRRRRRGQPLPFRIDAHLRFVVVGPAFPRRLHAPRRRGHVCRGPCARANARATLLYVPTRTRRPRFSSSRIARRTHASPRHVSSRTAGRGCVPPRLRLVLPRLRRRRARATTSWCCVRTWLPSSS